MEKYKINTRLSKLDAKRDQFGASEFNYINKVLNLI